MEQDDTPFSPHEVWDQIFIHKLFFPTFVSPITSFTKCIKILIEKRLMHQLDESRQ